MIDMAIDGVGTLTRAAEDAAQAASHERSFADAASGTEQAARRPKPNEAAPAAPADKSWWDSFKGAVGSAAHVVDAGAHQLGNAANHVAEDAISAGTDAVRHVAGDGVADVLHGAAEGVRETARQAVGFTYGVGAGATEAVGGMVEGTGDLIGDGVRMATDPAFRGQVVQGAEALAEHVAADPLGTAKAVGSGVLHAGEGWVRGAGRAAQEGNLGEYLGRGVGSAAVNVGSFFIPGAGEAEAANVAGHLGEAGKVAGEAGALTKVASHAAETMDGIVHGAPLVDNAGGAAKLTNGATGSVAHDASLEHVTPASAASDALAGSVKHVNISGSGQNCTNCAYSVDNQLATGAKSSALPRSEGVPFAKLNEMYKTNFSGWVSKSSIEKGMLSSGEGTRAIIYGMDAKGRTAHVWNAIVQNGSVNYIDGQTGGSGLRNFTDFAKFRFGITGGGR